MHSKHDDYTNADDGKPTLADIELQVSTFAEKLSKTALAYCKGELDSCYGQLQGLKHEVASLKCESFDSIESECCDVGQTDYVALIGQGKKMYSLAVKKSNQLAREECQNILGQLEALALEVK